MIIQHQNLTNLASAILHAAGAPEENAEAVALHLVEANLKGNDSHGVGMIPSYVRSMKAGHINPANDAKLIKDNGAVISFDAELSMGRVVGMQAMALGI